MPKQAVLKTVENAESLEEITESEVFTEENLSPKQEMFCQYIAEGKQQAIAFRMAYNPKTSKDKSIHEMASKLASFSKIRARIDYIKAFKDEVKNRTPADHRAFIIEHVTELARNGQTESTRLKALEMLGKTGDVGLFVEQVDFKKTDLSPEDLEKELTDKIRKLIKGKSETEEDETETVNDINDLF